LAQRYAAPAYRLVIAYSREIVLVLTARAREPRIEMTQIARIDLVRQQITDLGVMQLSAHAGTFDGIAWTVVAGVSMLVIDTTSAAREVLWHVPDQPSTWMVSAFSRNGDAHLLRTTKYAEYPPHWECWRYVLPGRRLAARETVSFYGTPALHPVRGLIRERFKVDRDGNLELFYHWDTECRVALGRVDPEDTYHVRLHCFDTVLIAEVVIDGGSRYDVLRPETGSCVAHIAWPGDGSAVREHDGHLLFVDGDGRLLDVDLATSLCRAVSVV
ncbi:MAG TPA: hypothetical protein VJ724_08660, partial [Tahibacter sp.]|nr:hypothetical protein [Tahibacter sp.]